MDQQPTIERIVVVRHGETEWSASGKHTSRTDVGLIEEGRRRAAELAKQLGGTQFAAVFCSPLRRARETCELAGFGDRAVICADLREWDYGDYEGLTTPEIRAQNPNWNLWRDGGPGGERPEQVAARVDGALERLRSIAGEALLFAHGHVLRVMGARWVEMEAAAGARFALGAGAIGVLGHERETQVLVHWNTAEL